jgi:toxin ParE1/3/4
MRKMRLEWSVFAQADRDLIFDYIEADRPMAAIAVDERIKSQVDKLARSPYSGRLGRIEGTRELVISHTPYIVAYRISSDSVRILRILHGAQRWPDDMTNSKSE